MLGIDPVEEPNRNFKANMVAMENLSPVEQMLKRDLRGTLHGKI